MICEATTTQPGTVVCIAGPISVGKTHFLQRIVEHCTAHSVSHTVLGELVSRTLFGFIDTQIEAVDAFMLAHRIQMAKDAPEIAKNYSFVFMERCIGDHLAFTNAFERCEMLPPKWAQVTRDVVKELDVKQDSRYIYLDIPPEKALERMKARGNEYDGAFSLEFIRALRQENIAKALECDPEAIILNWDNFGEDLDIPRLLETLSQKRGD